MNYRSKVQVTLANRAAAYRALSMFLLHLDALNVNLMSIVYNTTTKLIEITTSAPIPAAQHDHLGIVEVP